MDPIDKRANHFKQTLKLPDFTEVFLFYDFIVKRFYLQLCNKFIIFAMKFTNMKSPKLSITLFCLFLTVFLRMSGEEKDYLIKPLPEQWQMERQNFQTSPIDDNWWNCFEDSTLRLLIEKAVTNNFNVASAVKNIRMAQKSIGKARANYYPTLSASAGWTKSKEAGAMRMGESFTTSYFTLGASMNWEIDVFGRVYESVKEKKAALEVSRADYDGVIVSLCANLATAYMQLRVYQEELKVAKQHIESQSYVCKITESRFNAQLASMLDVTQAKIVLYETESSLPSIESNIRVMKNTIALLCGEYPGSLDSLLEDYNGMPRYEIDLSLGIPAEILRRRPDIVEAEMQLAEYAAAVGVAKRDFLPTLTLTGSVGTYSNNINHLFGKNSLGYSIEPQLSWTIFEGLARNYELAESKLQFEAAIDQYNYTVMEAMEEIDNAISEYLAYLEAIELQKRVVEQSKKSLDLSFELYRSGLTMFTNVVDSEIDWLTSENTLITMRGNALSSLISIYQALGGGWEQFQIK